MHDKMKEAGSLLTSRVSVFSMMNLMGFWVQVPVPIPQTDLSEEVLICRAMREEVRLEY